MVVTATGSAAYPKEIKILPERDLKILKARKELIQEGKEVKAYRISKMTGIPQTKVKERLEKIEQYYPLLLDFIKDARKTKYTSVRQSNCQRFFGDEGFLHGLELEKQMLRQGLWPFGASTPYGCIYDEKTKTLRLDPVKEPTLKKFIERCADGEVPQEVARELGVPKHQAYIILDSTTYKGRIIFHGETFQFKSLAVVDEETWDKAHRLHQFWASHGKKRPHAPLGTKWVGNNLVPHDPDNKIGRLCDLRLKRYSFVAVGKELGISWSRVYLALKRKRLYVDLGMVDAKTWEKVQQVHIDFGEAARREGDASEGEILKALLRGPLTFNEIMKTTGFTNTTVMKHLRHLQRDKHVVEKESGHRGKRYLVQ